MQQLFSTVLIMHIAGGTLALITGLLAIVTTKGGRTHRTGGNLFFGAMTLVFITALVMALMKGLTFLLMVAFFSYHMLLRGYRALYLKKQHLGMRMAWPDIAINGVGAIFNTGLIVWGSSQQFVNSNYIHIVAVFFGFIGIWMVSMDVKRFIKPPKEKQQWLYTHIGGMCGAYTAAVTAFMVVNVHFLPGLVVWTAPVIVGLILITMTVARYKRKFNKHKQAAPAPVASIALKR